MIMATPCAWCIECIEGIEFPDGGFSGMGSTSILNDTSILSSMIS